MLNNVLYDARVKSGLKLRELSSETGIDQALLSKFEKGTRNPTLSQLEALAGVYHFKMEEIKKEWLADKLLKIIRYEPNAMEVLHLAESRVEYLSSKNALKRPEISEKINEALEYVDLLKEKWQSNKPLNFVQLGKMEQYFNVAYTFESNRIEGNTLTLQETDLVVNQGLTIGGKSVREHMEAINHQHAIDFVKRIISNDETVSRRVILEVHRLILKEIDNDNAGNYRTVPVRISGSRHKPPQPYLLDKLMEDLFEHYYRQQHVLHPVILAAEMHERLVSIHPFIDGNGRTSRLLMNMILISNGYTIANIKGDNASRLAYYRALEKVQMDNDPEPFYELVVDVVRQSLEDHLEMV